MKPNINTLLLAILIIMIGYGGLYISKQIADLNRETVVYWMIPKKAPCKIMTMFLPARSWAMTCSFTSGIAQPIKPVKDPLDETAKIYKFGNGRL